MRELFIFFSLCRKIHQDMAWVGFATWRELLVAAGIDADQVHIINYTYVKTRYLITQVQKNHTYAVYEIQQYRINGH